MKHKIFFLFLILFIALSGCKKEAYHYQNDFEKSYTTWLSFKAKTNNSYQYVVGGGSWTGMGWSTTLTVQEGKVMERSFRLSVPDDWQGDIPEEHREWAETGDEVGSHQDTPAALPITLDEIYEKGKTFWLLKRKNAKTYLSAENDGLISQCGFIIDGCQDDCFNGITITKIEALTPEP